MKNVIRKSNHGGKREGAGREKGSGFYNQTPVTVKLTSIMIKILKDEAEEKGTSVSFLIREAVYEKYHPMAGFTE